MPGRCSPCSSPVWDFLSFFSLYVCIFYAGWEIFSSFSPALLSLSLLLPLSPPLPLHFLNLIITLNVCFSANVPQDPGNVFLFVSSSDCIFLDTPRRAYNKCCTITAGCFQCWGQTPLDLGWVFLRIHVSDYGHCVGFTVSVMLCIDRTLRGPSERIDFFRS